MSSGPSGSGERSSGGRPPLPDPKDLLPAYENLPDLVRRVVRDELPPVVSLLEEIRGAVARKG